MCAWGRNGAVVKWQTLLNWFICLNKGQIKIWSSLIKLHPNSFTVILDIYLKLDQDIDQYPHIVIIFYF